MAYNIGYACTTLQVERGMGDAVALRWLPVTGPPQDYTFGQLDQESCKFASLLEGLGMRPGELLSIVLPKSVEVFVGFLGALKARVIVSPLFHSFGEEALADRLGDSAARAVLIRRRSLKKLRSLRGRLPALDFVIVTDLPQAEARPSEGILSYEGLMAQASTSYGLAREFGAVDIADVPSVLHYTSGSTGKPKGVLHVHGSLAQQEATATEVLGLGPGVVFWCTADQGWVTGTSYGIVAPWSVACTQIHCEGGYHAATWLRVLQEQKVAVWYTAPTALRMLMREDLSLFEGLRLGELRSVFSVGEPLNPECIHWAQRVLGKQVHDTWFQTETGAIMIANRPGLPVKPGSMGRPTGLVHAAVVGEDGGVVPAGVTGDLVVTAGWPAMFRAYVGRPEAYEARFRGGSYYTGDLARTDEDGYFWFVGRGDDVINTAGHLVGPFEVESALLEVPEVAEAAVVGVPDEMLHQKIVAFVALKPGIEHSRELELRMRLQVQNRVSTIATPQDIVVVDLLPKNDSGKILRRVLRDQYKAQ